MPHMSYMRERVRALLDCLRDVRADQLAAVLSIPKHEASSHLATLAYEGELVRVPVQGRRCRTAYRRAA